MPAGIAGIQAARMLSMATEFRQSLPE